MYKREREREREREENVDVIDDDNDGGLQVGELGVENWVFFFFFSWNNSKVMLRKLRS